MTREQKANIEKLTNAISLYQDRFIADPTFENKQVLLVATAILDNYKKAI